MQTSETSNQKKSLFNAMSRFVGAVNNMDQTVMVPSLLRDVPLDKELGAMEAGGGDSGPYLQQDGDMYSSYVLLKSIRDDMERGVLQGDEWRRDKEDEDDDLEQLFHFHLNGLHGVLSQLTRRANALTRRYKEEIGYRN